MGLRQLPQGAPLPSEEVPLKGLLQSSALLYGSWVFVALKRTLWSALSEPQKGASLPGGGSAAPVTPARSAPEQLVVLRAQISKESAEWLSGCSADIGSAQFRIGGA